MSGFVSNGQYNVPTIVKEITLYILSTVLFASSRSHKDFQNKMFK